MKRTLISILICLFLSSCSNIVGDKDTLNCNLGFEPLSLDWHLASDSYSFDIISNIMVGLTRYTKTMGTRPGCAKSWKISSDNTELIFYLNDKAKWTDGVPVLAQHFVDAFNRALDPQTAAPYADLLSQIDLNETKALDDFTLRIKLKAPAAYFIGLTSYGLMLPIRKDLIDKYGDSWTEPEHLITNGPYRLKTWQHEYKILLERNPDFHLAPGKVKFLKFFMVPEQSSAFTLYENGQFDWIDKRSIPNSEMRNVVKRDDAIKTPLLRNTYVGFNVNKAPFDNKLVRQAFFYAINRKFFNKVIGRGELPLASWIPPGLSDYFDKERGIEFKPDLARKLLAQAGYPAGKGFPEVDFFFPSTEEAKLISETMQSLWKRELGITVKLVSMEWKVYLDTIDRDPPHLFRLNWGADYPDPDTFMQLFTSKNQMNHGGWINPEYDKLVSRAAQITSVAQRQKLYQRAEAILTKEEMAIIPLFVDSQLALKKPYVSGLTINPMDTVFLDEVSKQ